MKYLFIRSILAAGFLVTLFGCPPKPVPSEPKPSIAVSIDQALLDRLDQTRPKEVFVYEIIPGDPRRWLSKFSDVLNLKGETTEDEELISMKNGPRVLEVRKISTSVFQGDMDRLWKEEPTPDSTEFNVPGNEEAQKISADLLQRLGFTAQSIQDLDISISNEAFELTLASDPNKTIESIVGKNVEVRRKINGLKVFGPGSKIKVYIGGKSRLNGMTAVWRQFLPKSAELGHVPQEAEPKGRNHGIVGAKDAFDVLKKNPLKNIPIMLVDSIVINQVEVGYYERSASEPQKFLQPVYVFRGTAYSDLPNGKRSQLPYEQYVVALKEPLESIVPEGNNYKPEIRTKDKVLKKDEDERGEQKK